ncbi:MAG: hypothetical protein HPY83_13625 [Anaerolineae bacterium]|nr:hypothetical protein [Anaerolineae bacterium]
MSLLGLDIGTTGCKAIVFGEDFRILGAGYREYPLLQPRPGWAELDPVAVWANVEEAIREAVVQAGRADPVRGVAASVQGEAACPVDEHYRPLGNSIVTFDPRTIPQARRLGEVVGAEAVYRLSGQPLHPMGTVNKIAWWKEERPETYARTHKFLCFSDFALSQLGVEPVMDPSMAARTMAYDIASRTWSPDVLGAFGIDESILPRVAESGTAVGVVPNAVAERLGLPPGVVASTGGHDQPCGALGAGAVSPGTAMYAIGTVECVTPCLDAFVPGLGSRGFPCYPHVAPNLFVTLGFNFGGGSILRWYRDQFGQAENNLAQQTGASVYDLLLQPVDTSPGSLMLLPHFAGTGTPWLDPESKGALIGLTLGSSKADVVKAILEGTTYEIAYNVEEMRSAGVPLAELRAIGGGSRSATWLQIKADILGVPLARLSISEAACLGAALLAGRGAGQFGDVGAVASSVAVPERVFEPDPDRHARHSERLVLYRRLYPSLRDLLHAL